MGRSLSSASGARLMPRITRYGFSREAGRIVRPDKLIRCRKPVRDQIPERGVGHGSRDLPRDVIGHPQAPTGLPQTAPAREGERTASAPPIAPRRPPDVLLPLPKLGEMEKRYDPRLRGLS
jgi:hypothetical protein